MLYIPHATYMQHVSSRIPNFGGKQEKSRVLSLFLPKIVFWVFLSFK